MPAASHQPPQSLPNSAFLRELATAAPNGTTLWVSAFLGNPDLANGRDWSGSPYSPATMADVVDGWGAMNTYFSVGSLRYDEAGGLARRKSHFARLLALVGDDVQIEDMQGAPSWVLQTSPGKRQVGLLLDRDDPDCADMALCTRLVTTMAERGMLKADPSGNNVVRYVRLPAGQNQKPRESGAWTHVLEAWHPGARYTLADAAGILGIDLDTLRQEAQPGAAPKADGHQAQLLGTLTENISRGEYLHDSLNAMAASMVASGMPGGAVVNVLRGLMSGSRAPRDERWQARYDDIPRAVSTAQAKFAPVVVDLSAFKAAQQQHDEESDEGATAASDHAPAVDVPARLLTIPGMLGMAVDWINNTARKPQPLFAVQAGLALGSTILGRRYCTDNANWPSLYFLNVGPSGCGKEHAKYAVERLLESAGLGDLIGVGRFASESSVISSLIDKPAQFSVLDEFGKFLQAASVPNNFSDRNIVKALMEVWGRADGVLRPVAYSTAGMSSKQSEDLAKRLVRNPAMTLLAMTTPDTLFHGLTSDSVADGMLNRLLTVYSDRGRQLARTVQPIDPPQALLDWMLAAHAASSGGTFASIAAQVHDLAPTPIVVPLDAGARRVFEAMEQALLARMDGLEKSGLHEMLARATEIAMRVGLIVAVSAGHDKVLRHDAEYGRDYVLTHGDRHLAMLRDRLSDGAFDALCKEVLRLVRAAAERGMTERDMDKASRAWRKAANQRTREDALRSLERRDEIVKTLIPSSSGRGRQRFAWVTQAVAAKFADNADKSPTHASPQ